jgi:multiple sugar transport system substrate-binding protein
MKQMLYLVFAVILLISCGKKENTVEVNFWAHGGGLNMNNFAKQRILEFNQNHPNIKAIFNQKSWNLIRELLYTNFSTGTGPDLMRIHANYAAEFGEAEHLYPINKFPDFEQVKSWYEPNLFESTRYKDNYYGLPSSGIAFVLVCNKDLFDKEGLEPPKTWSEFRAVAKKLTKDTNGDGNIDQWGLVLLGGDRGGFSYRLAPFWFKAGVEVLSDDLTKVTFNSPRAVETLKLFADMYQVDKSITPGFLAYTLSEINDLFCSNKVAMSIEGPWMSLLVEEKCPGKKFYTVPVPVPDDMIDQYETAPTLQDMVMIAVSAHSKHLNEAWELTKFLRNEEADMNWVLQDMGGYPTTLKALNSPEMNNFHFADVFRNELKHAKPWPAHPNMIAIVRNVIAPYGQKGIVGELTPQQALDQAAAEAQAIMDGKK